MANKKCANGHQYDAAIYGDNCPFCPSGKTRVNGQGEMPTVPHNGDLPTVSELPTDVVKVGNVGGGRTVIRRVGGNDSKTQAGDNRQMVGLLVSYDLQSGLPIKVFSVYEGVTLIGKLDTCDISFPEDSAMSREHLMIQFAPGVGKFKAQDKGSSNGTYLNGTAYGMGEIFDLNNNDVLVMGATKLLFIALPQL